MIRIIFIFLGITIACPNWSNAQSGAEESFLLNEVPKEQVYLHVNSTFLLGGEQLLYKFYCLNSNTYSLSNLSKVGWVVLVNSDHEVIFKHKLKLDQGQGYSDFLLPSNLPSGPYKILGYTNWMQNASENFFQQDIHVLNPYQEERKGMLLEEDTSGAVYNPEFGANQGLSLNLNKALFSHREEVVVSISNSEAVSGDFSVSIRHIDNFDKPYRMKSVDVNQTFPYANWDFSDTVILPELRGSLLAGRVLGKDGRPLKNRSLLLGIPGEKDQIKSVLVDENGRFIVSANHQLDDPEMFVQLSNHTKDDYSVILKESANTDFSSLMFDPLRINPALKDHILKKSIHNQIEHAFSASKRDRKPTLQNQEYFFDQELLKFNLDDYKRFTEVSQTFVEIIKYGRVKRNTDGTHSILVRNINTNGEFKLPALLIVDGIVVQDHDKLISFNAEKIESISLLRSRFFSGPEIYQGVVVVETKENDFPVEFRTDYIKSVKISATQQDKEYYNPIYSGVELDRIPDYRYQLLWDPQVAIKLNEYTFSFYTSDISGIFEINLEGFTSEGRPISLHKTFEVH